MKQKHFMDINRISFGDEIKVSNISGFQPNDKIQISEKIDGANASIRWDEETNILTAFSRKKLLDAENNLNGFYEFAQTVDQPEFKTHPSWIVFGEWLTKHTVTYNQQYYGQWYVYDIYNVDTQEYLPQNMVKDFCASAHLHYIHVLYEGPFTSWEKALEYAKEESAYGANQMEGIVIKNQTQLNNPDEKTPFVLKYVNSAFAETKHSNHIKKISGPNQDKAKKEAYKASEKIVTKQRIQKEILKMQDEGILPEKISPQNMKTISEFLPNRIYNDCVKEEQNYVNEIGQFFERCCSQLSMNFAREIVLGK